MTTPVLFLAYKQAKECQCFHGNIFILLAMQQTRSREKIRCPWICLMAFFFASWNGMETLLLLLLIGGLGAEAECIQKHLYS